MLSSKLKQFLTGLFLLILNGSALFGGEYKLELPLIEGWRFEIGDDMAYSRPDYNDSRWDKITAGKKWEDLGYPGLDGYAWYRITFFLPENLTGQKLYLRLGKIDDVDQTFINGKFIAQSGEFPPKLRIAYDADRIYPLPEGDLQFGQNNTLAVRVYDRGGEGGIVKGPVGICSRIDEIEMVIPLEGAWKFRTGDDDDWANPGINEKKWTSIYVPDNWEKQGFEKHDGMAWYRRTIFIPEDLQGKELLILLGKINDIDETYLNGKKIGQTGKFPKKNKKPDKKNYKKFYKLNRAYPIPTNLIHWGENNTIAVRIFDFGNKGGIYKGDIGICTRAQYEAYLVKKEKN